MDEIRIDNLEIYAGHGVYEDENASGQPFFVNAVLYTDTREAGWKDALALSTHYGEVSHLLNRYLREHTFRLIDAAAERAADRSAGHLIAAVTLAAGGKFKGGNPYPSWKYDREKQTCAVEPLSALSGRLSGSVDKK